MSRVQTPPSPAPSSLTVSGRKAFGEGLDSSRPCDAWPDLPFPASVPVEQAMPTRVFPPLIQPYGRFSRIRLSDHRSPCGVRPVSDAASTDVDETHGVELAVRVAPPLDPSLTVPVGQILPHPPVDEALKPAKGLRRVRVLEVVRPTADGVVDPCEELRRLHRGPTLRDAPNVLADALLTGLGGEDTGA